MNNKKESRLSLSFEVNRKAKQVAMDSCSLLVPFLCFSVRVAAVLTHKSQRESLGSGARFSKIQKHFRARKAMSKTVIVPKSCFLL